MSVFSSSFEFLDEEAALARSPSHGLRAGFKPRRPRWSGWSLLPRCLPPLLAALDVLAIVLVTGLASLAYEQEIFALNDMVFGFVLASGFVIATAARHGYLVSAYLKPKGQMRHVVNSWLLAFVAVITIGFFTKTGEFFSRGLAGLDLVLGLVTMLVTRKIVSQALIARAKDGRIAARSIFVVGDEASVRTFSEAHDFPALGLRLVGCAVIRPEQGGLAEDLALAGACARMLRPNDIFILAPWGDRDLITDCIDTFVRLPASIHIGPDPVFQHFSDMHVVRNGPLTSVHLVRSPLSPLEAAAKRFVDLVISATALVAVSPLLLAIAVLIKADSPGPVFFRQTRYGFNQEPFRIVKFRTMSVLEDGAAVRQATIGDGRITRAGTWLRRSNLDELPQLFNVLRGEMSLVGPRPHALAHDQAFGRSVSLYARRHNVRPGITGWAQVQGWRGETDTIDKIQRRIECDLYYIDNWSLWLDFVVLARTLLSRSAYLNAR